ncbi:MAG: tetratricopeptide repeat protein [Pseudomonadota bacterium]|nr:tetratricopeptide repeat protein [Pseudomonadota bacterium]
MFQLVFKTIAVAPLPVTTVKFFKSNEFALKLNRLLFNLLAGIGFTAVLSGCALTKETSTGVQVQKPSVEPDKVAESVNHSDGVIANSPLLDSATMFEILAAEMMVQKGQVANAFNILYPLAEKTKDKGLAKRVFQVSMATYNVANIEKATVLWREVSPESSTAWRASFLLSLRQSQLELAIEQWQTYRQLSKDGLAADLISSAAKVAASVPKEPGLQFFTRLSQEYNQAWTAYYALGMVSTVYQDPSVGIPAIEKALLLLPKSERQASSPLLYNLLSKLYLMNGNPEKGIEVLASYVESHPNDLLLQERMARLEVQAKRYEAAERRYQTIINIEPEAYTSLLSLALIQLERKAYDSAEKNLLAVSQDKAYQSVGNYYLGILYQDSDRYELAISTFKKVKSASYYVDAQLHLAEIYFAQNKSDESFAILDAMNLAQPADQVKVLRAKAIFNSAQDKYLSAVDLYNQVLKIEPGNIEVLKAQSLLLYKLEQYIQYEANLLKVLKLDDNDVDVLNALGYFYVEQNMKLDQAFMLLNKALEIDPKSYYILDSMGWYYFQVKDYGKALNYLNKAFSVEEDDEVLIHLITAYWHNKEVNRAKSLWQKYHKKFLQNDRVQNLINELESEAIK